MRLEELTSAEVYKDRGKFTLVDVREPFELSGSDGFIEGAILATLGEEFTAFIETADPKKTYVFICRSGHRSLQATEFAKLSGLSQSYNLKGGMIAWNEYVKSL